MRSAVLCVLAACSFEHGRVGGMTKDDAGVDGPSVTADAAPDARPMRELVAAYNINGAAFTGVDYPGAWATDPGNICDGEPWTVTFDVTGTVDDPLFQKYDFRTGGGAINCAVGANVAAGMYEVTLLFAEVYNGPGCTDPAAQRIFDILIEGVRVEDNLNTLTAGGCCDPDATTPGMPFARVYNVMVGDGTVDIVLDAEPTRGTMISALMVQRL